MSNINVVEDVTSFLKSPRTHWDHSWARRIEEMELGFHLWITRQFCDEHITKSMAMLHNLCFAGLKLVFHSIINGLHNWLSPYTSDSSIVQNNLPFWEESNIFILEKFTLITKSTLLELCTCSFCVHFFLPQICPLIFQNFSHKISLTQD